MQIKGLMLSRPSNLLNHFQIKETSKTSSRSSTIFVLSLPTNGAVCIRRSLKVISMNRVGRGRMGRTQKITISHIVKLVGGCERGKGREGGRERARQ